MEPLPGRKALALALESLEQRQMLSLMVPPAGWGYETPRGPSQFDRRNPETTPIDHGDPGLGGSQTGDPAPGIEVHVRRPEPLLPDGRRRACRFSNLRGPGGRAERDAGRTPEQPGIVRIPIYAPGMPDGDHPGGGVAPRDDRALDSAGPDGSGSAPDRRDPGGSSVPFVVTYSIVVTPPSRGPSVVLAGRTGGSDPSAVRNAPVAAHDAPILERAVAENALAVNAVNAAPGDAAAGVVAHAGGIVSNLPGQRAAGAQPALVLVATGDQGAADALPRGGAPFLASLVRPGVVDSHAGTRAAERPAEELGVPDPQLAGLITTFLPHSRASLEYAIERFLEPLDELGLGSTVPELRGPLGLVPATLAVAASALALDLALRVRRPAGKRIELDGDAGPAWFPGLPALWRWSHR